MLDHPIVDVAMGLVFFYIVLSLVASAVREWLATLQGLRAKNLRKGIGRLLGEPYAQLVYDHPLIRNLALEKRMPSYIAPETLSLVLLEVLSKNGDGGKSYVTRSADEVRALVAEIDEAHPLREILEAMVTDAEDAAGALKDRLAGWFDEGMERISGWYNRRSKFAIFVIAAAVTLATNANSIQIAEELWRNDALRAEISAQAQAAAGHKDVTGVTLDDAGRKALQAFPIGWSTLPEGEVGWLKAILGWLITIAAVSLGAPFWFDLLGKVANLRGAGKTAK